ncbi:hypothetical protein ACFC0D_37010 [Streptomyces sp. NPDC056222]|uniref:hypothetical protein n=1 Tax=Streptomyces sp. NPDC056222 TaxID=3345749 RepID=UPI0035E2CA27
MLQIFEVEESRSDAAVCIVRCVGGQVRPGDRFEGGALLLDRIQLYGREVPEFTPPLSARVLLSGTGVRVLRPWIVIVSDGPRRYGYVGPPEIRAAAAGSSPGRVMRTPEDFTAWVAGQGAADLDEPFTYVVDEGGFLRLAPRRSEHVACAGRGWVRAAGEMAFVRGPGGWEAVETSNQSTGYCPDPDSWPSVAAALDRVGLTHEGRFIHEVVFRRCPACAELNVVRDGEYVCALCGNPLPFHWNPAWAARPLEPERPAS